MEELKTKKCAKCKRELPITEFYRNKSANDGLQFHCKDCTKEYDKLKSEKKRQKVDGVSRIQANNQRSMLCKEYAHAELAKFTPRQLMEELKARGFKWEYMLEPQKKIMFDKI